jgi:hypothetical protein
LAEVQRRAAEINYVAAKNEALAAEGPFALGGRVLGATTGWIFGKDVVASGDIGAALGGLLDIRQAVQAGRAPRSEPPAARTDEPEIIDQSKIGRAPPQDPLPTPDPIKVPAPAVDPTTTAPALPTVTSLRPTTPVVTKQLAAGLTPPVQKQLAAGPTPPVQKQLAAGPTPPVQKQLAAGPTPPVQKQLAAGPTPPVQKQPSQNASRDIGPPSLPEVKADLLGYLRDVQRLAKNHPHKLDVLAQLRGFLKEVNALEGKSIDAKAAQRLEQIQELAENLDELVADDVVAATANRNVNPGSVATVAQVQQPSTPRTQPPQLTAGNEFDDLHAFDYPYRELQLVGPNGEITRLDGYDPGRWIVSRKNVQLSDIPVGTARDHINEILLNFPQGRVIRQVPSSGLQTGGLPVGMRGRMPANMLTGTLQGQHVLEVPIQTNPVPPQVLSAAKSAGVIIRDVAGTVY